MAGDSREAWLAGRPVYQRLPQIGYRDNTLVDALTDWVDFKLSEKKGQLEAWHLELDPDTCQDASLDYLGWLVGFSGSFWDTNWSPEVKRELIRLSHSYIWSYRGTLQVIKKILDVHQLDYSIWQDGQSILSFRLPQQFGGQGLRMYLRLPLKYRRSAEEWKESQRTLNNYCPAVTKSKVCYRQFYQGFSRIGDPLFRGSPNRAPLAPSALSFTSIYGETLTGQLSLGTDPDGDTLSYLTGTYPTQAGGIATVDATGYFTYTAKAGYKGLDSFHYGVSDGRLASAVEVAIDADSKLIWLDRFEGANGVDITSRVPDYRTIAVNYSATGWLLDGSGSAISSSAYKENTLQISTGDIDITAKVLWTAFNTDPAFWLFARSAGNLSNAIALSLNTGQVSLVSRVSAVPTALMNVSHTFTANTLYTIRFRLSGAMATVWVNGVQKINHTSTPLNPGWTFTGFRNGSPGSQNVIDTYALRLP